MSQNVGAIVLAAGKGTRMGGKNPKVLERVCGLPLLSYPLMAFHAAFKDQPISVVTGFQREKVESFLKEFTSSGPGESLGSVLNTIEQKEQLGTAHAVSFGLKAFDPEKLPEYVFILNGDAPLITMDDLETMFEMHTTMDLEVSVLTADLEQDWNLPISQLGRIVRNEEGELSKIVEYKDATEEERAICEMNSGCYLFKLDFLAEMLSKVGTDNVQGEYYLPDLVEMAEKKEALLSNFSECVLGVNDRKEQALIHKILRQKKVGMLLEQGVEIMDPDRVDIDWDVRVGAGTRIWPGVSLLSGSKIGEDCEIENMVRVEASTIDQNVHLKQGTVIEDSKVEKFAQCGPYAHLRPGTRIGEEVKIGNFVETKKALFYKGAKASHLSYIGDAEVGERSNIGCGFITCNYDAYRKKNKTIIGKDVFMGSDCQTVAPVEIGDESVIASGSTITKDVPPKALSFARSKQVNKEGYADKYKKS